ncbi:MAG: hypothetical protein AAF485_20135, partial [Chloroflexota bacterium]
MRLNRVPEWTSGKFKPLLLVVSLVSLGACNYNLATPTIAVTKNQIVSTHTVTAAPAVTKTPTVISNTPTPLPTLEPQPQFIAEAWPSPGNRVTLEFYQADLMDEIDLDTYEGARPVEEAGHQSNICIYLDTSTLGELPSDITSDNFYPLITQQSTDGPRRP